MAVVDWGQTDSLSAQEQGEDFHLRIHQNYFPCMMQMGEDFLVVL